MKNVIATKRVSARDSTVRIEGDSDLERTVSPKVHIAAGIPGAGRHLVVINKDDNGPIFEIAGCGVAGGLFEVVPALTPAMKKSEGSA